MQIDQTLKDVFGLDKLRPAQEPVIEAMCAGHDVLAILPTGGGKSLCYQLPALVRPGLTLVISPLIALMRDQVRALEAAGVAAGALTSANAPEENQAVMEAAASGTLRLLYVAPERLGAPSLLGLLRHGDLTTIAVDEAHCVSQWGHDFRPDYLRIRTLAQSFPDAQIAAFTATADSETRAEIAERLFTRPPVTFVQGFDRPNIHIAFAPKDRPRAQVIAYAKARAGRAGIIYVASRKKAESLADALAEGGLAAIPYHAGLPPETRRRAEERFQREDGLIVVATVAFGMGIDKPDIRYVLHADLPKSVEAYYQEIGRAGRDGDPAEAMTLFGADDIRLRRTQIDEGAADLDRKQAEHGRLNALLGIAEATGCRRQRLLGFFGEDTEACGNCDCCARPPETFDATEVARMALSAMLRTEERFGAGYVIDLLLGHSSDRMRAQGHDALPTFGIGKAVGRGRWQSILRQMQGHDLVRPDPERHGALRVMPTAHPLLRGEAVLTLRKDAAQAATPVRAAVPEEDAPLFAALKSRRRALAEAQNVPAYVVFPDRTLQEMARQRPASLDAMRQIPGVGATKLARYGAAFLAVITGEITQTPHPARLKRAARGEGDLLDQLLAVERDLARGENGLDTYLQCGTQLLARLIARHPRDLAGIEAVIGAPKAERFGAAFLALLDETAIAAQ